MAFTSGGIVYVAGGRDDVGTALDTVIAIDPSSGKLAAAPKMPAALSDSAVATTANGPTIFIGGAGLAATRSVLQTRTISTSSIAAPSAETLKDPPISTPFAQHLSPAAAQRPFAGKLLIADRGNNRLLVMNAEQARRLAYPSPNLPAPAVPFYFPDDAFWVHGGHAILVNEEENDVLAEIAYPSGRCCGPTATRGSAARRPATSHQPDDLYPYPGGGLVVADAKNCRILFFDAGRPTVAADRHRPANCTPGLPETVGYPNGDTPLPNGHLLVSESYGGWVDEVTSGTGTSSGRRQSPGPPALGPAAAGGRLLPRGRLRAPGAVVRFRPEREGALDLPARLRARGCSTIRASPRRSRTA